ncbi:MAG: hypothetical protein JST86_14985 [Bacteroidetes bacterium]|nr:hypothetical protein [Bacteroidota bacterium]
MRKSFLVMMMVFCGFWATAQSADSVYVDSAYNDAPKADEEEKVTFTANDTLYIDTSLQYRMPAMDKDSIAYWRNMKGFAYTHYLDSLLKAEQNKKNKEDKPQEQQSSSGSNWLIDLLSSRAFQVILWILAGGFILFVLFRLFLSDGVFRRNTKSAVVVTEQPDEEKVTDKTNLSALIQQAAKEGNYRLAIRYQYLQTLYKLAAKNLVQLAADKTNYQYVREISNYQMQNEFSALTLNYEYVWYGEFAIDDAIYQKLVPSFTQFNSKL